MNLSHNQVEAAICYVARTYRRAHVPLTERTEVKEGRGGVWVPAEIFVPDEEIGGDEE